MDVALWRLVVIGIQERGKKRKKKKKILFRLRLLPVPDWKTLVAFFPDVSGRLPSGRFPACKQDRCSLSFPSFQRLAVNCIVIACDCDLVLLFFFCSSIWLCDWILIVCLCFDSFSFIVVLFSGAWTWGANSFVACEFGTALRRLAHWESRRGNYQPKSHYL